MTPQTGICFVRIMGIGWTDMFACLPLWNDLSFSGAATTFQAVVQKVLSPTSISLSVFSPFPFFSIQASLDFWQISGTLANGDDFFEYVGDLMNRETHPTAADNGGAGGPTLQARRLAPGLSQLYWGT